MVLASPPPFVIAGAPLGSSPLIVGIPHAGRFYPPELERNRAVPQTVLEELEDRFVDRLALQALARDATLVIACWARAWLDLNRDVDETEGNADGMRVRAGLGLVPTRLAGRELWHAPFAPSEIAARIETLHSPYHAAIAHALAEARAQHGFAMLVDCHSMPSLVGRNPARIVIGDRHGASAGAMVSAAAVGAVAGAGLAVTRNAPYAGAYILDRHGRPAGHVHALQIEIDRSLYLDRGSRGPGEGFDFTAALLAETAWRAVDAARPERLITAAE